MGIASSVSQKICLIDATTYSIELDDHLYELKKRFYGIKSHAQKEFFKNNMPKSGYYGYSRGLLRIATILEAQNGRYKIDYKSLEEAPEYINKIRANPSARPEIVGFGAITPTIPSCAEIARQLKDVNPNIQIVLGGVHARTASVLTKNRYPVFDNVIVQEDEIAAMQLVEGETFNATTDFIKYSYLFHALKNYCLNVSTGMGCNYACAYCLDRFDHYRNSIDWINDFNFLCKTGLPRNTRIHFCDSELGGSIDRAIEICTTLSKLKHNLILSCDLRPEYLYKTGLSALLQKAGFKEVRIGIDSADDLVNSCTGRGNDINRTIDILEKLKSTDIYVSAYFVTGLPGSNKNTGKQNRMLVQTLMQDNLVHQIKHHLYVPYPSDKAAYIPQGVKIEENDWSKYDRLSFPVYSLVSLSREEIWNEYLQLEQEIVSLWSDKFKGNIKHKGYIRDYNQRCYRLVKEEAREGQERKSVSILHISDFHIAKENSGIDVKARLSHLKLQDRQDTLKQYLDSINKAPDFVVFSGDITYQGQEQGYPIMQRFVEDLQADGVFPSDDSRIIVVPGNHDVNSITRFDNFISAMQYVIPYFGEYNDIKEYIEYLVSSSIINSKGMIGGRFEKPIYGISHLPFIFDFQNKVLIYAFNSAVASQTKIDIPPEIKKILNKLKKDDRNKINSLFKVDASWINQDEINTFLGFMGSVKAIALQKGIFWNDIIKVAVLHHHVAPISPCDEIKEFQFLLNAGRFKKILHQAGFQVILHGHQHWPEPYYDSAISGGGEHLVVSGGVICDEVAVSNSATGTEKKMPGFFLLDLYPSDKTIDVKYINLETDKADSPTIELSETYRLKSVSNNEKSRRGYVVHSLIELSLNKLLDKFEITDSEAGWPSNLAQNGISSVGTSYGLRIQRYLIRTDPLLLSNRQKMLNAILNRKLCQDNGWAIEREPIDPKSARPARPDVSAWIIDALSTYGDAHTFRQGIRDIEKLIEIGLKNEYFKSCYPTSMILDLLMNISPANRFSEELFDNLVSLAKRDSSGRILHWTCRGIPSKVHTAQAIIAMEQTRLFLKKMLPDITQALNWLKSDTEENITEEDIYFKEDRMIVNHFPDPWISLALMKIGTPVYDVSIMKRIENILSACDGGLWNPPSINKYPIWATHDALRALVEYSIRT